MARANLSGLPDTHKLIQVVPTLKKAQKFLLDRFFPNTVTSDTEFVDIDIIKNKRRMSPFVSPMVGGRVVESLAYQTNTLKPAYIKDKRPLDVLKPIRRQAGERIGGEMSPYERMEMNIMLQMEDQVDMLDRRQEWMASQALVYGKYTIEGDGYPKTEINFQRSDDLSIKLAAKEKWGATGVRPTKDVEKWAIAILKESGAVSRDIIFTPSAWDEFIKDEVVAKALLYAGSGAGNTVNIGAEVDVGAVYKGRWGQFDLWLYNDWFIDYEIGEDGKEIEVEKPMIEDGYIIMTGSQLDGTRAFGTILDPEASYQAMPYAPKIWTEKDPAVTYLLMQSSPLVIPTRVNACLSAKVV